MLYKCRQCRSRVTNAGSIATNCCITATDEQGHGHIVRPLLAIRQPSRAFRATDDLANYFFRFQLCKFCLNQLQP